MAALVDSLSSLRRFLFGSWLSSIFGAWFVLLMLAFAKNAVVAKVNDRVMALGILTSGLSTFLFWAYRSGIKGIVAGWRLSPALRFVLIGGAGAAWAEFIFWAYQTAFRITGVAANASFGLDLVVTMPWYLLMLVLLWQVVTRQSYTYRELVLLGGVYDLCADGLLRQAIGGSLTPAAAALDVVAMPMFVVAYSIMVLPPCVLLAEEIGRARERRQRRPRFRLAFGLLPVAGLLVYGAALFVLGTMLWR